MTPRTVIVEASARLHFGLLDLRGALGRRFGGIGASAPVVGVRIAVSAANVVRAEGPDASRAKTFARLALARLGVGPGVDIRIERAMGCPFHVRRRNAASKLPPRSIGAPIRKKSRPLMAAPKGSFVW